MPLNSVEPPCTDPYARWCGRGGAARLPPIPICASALPGDTPPVPPLGEQLWALRPRLDGGVPAVNGFTPDARRAVDGWAGACAVTWRSGGRKRGGFWAAEASNYGHSPPTPVSGDPPLTVIVTMPSPDSVSVACAYLRLRRRADQRQRQNQEHNAHRNASSLATSGSCRSVERPRAPPRRVRRFRPAASGTVGAHEPGERPFSANPTPRRCAITRRRIRFPRPPAGPRRRPRTGAEPAGPPTRRQRPVDGSSTARLSCPRRAARPPSGKCPGPRAGGRGRARLARRRPRPHPAPGSSGSPPTRIRPPLTGSSRHAGRGGRVQGDAPNELQPPNRRRHRVRLLRCTRDRSRRLDRLGSPRSTPLRGPGRPAQNPQPAGERPPGPPSGASSVTPRRRRRELGGGVLEDGMTPAPAPGPARGVSPRLDHDAFDLVERDPRSRAGALARSWHRSRCVRSRRA